MVIPALAARVGGLWDSLLAEKRRFWVFVNSDFHSAAADADFYPIEKDAGPETEAGLPLLGAARHLIQP